LDTKNGAWAASSCSADRAVSDSLGADFGFEVRASHSAGACSGNPSRNVELKPKRFAAPEALAKPEAIIAANTSSTSIPRLAAATKRPEKAIGMHFLNPVPVMWPGSK